MNPLIIIDALRKSDEYIEHIYTQGSCYKFHLFLKVLYPMAIPLIDSKGVHIVTEICGEIFDITGKKTNKLHDTYRRMTKEELRLAETWSFRKNKYLQVGECPACEEPLIAKV